MSNDPTRFRRITVHIEVGKRQAHVSVLAVQAEGGRESRTLIWRGVLPGPPGVSTARGIVELALTALRVAADRL